MRFSFTIRLKRKSLHRTLLNRIHSYFSS